MTENTNPELTVQDEIDLGLLGGGTEEAPTSHSLLQVWQEVLSNVKGDPEAIPGVALWYSSTCTECSAGCGTLVRTRISEVRVVGRATQGVTLIGLDEGDVLSGVQKVMVSIDEDELDDSVDGDTPITSAETSSETPPETPAE